MRTIFAILSLALALFAAPASATDVVVTQVLVVSDGTSNKGIYVRGTFSPALPCAIQGYFVAQTDVLEREIFSVSLTALALSRGISYTHVSCNAAGYSVGTVFSMV